MHVTVTGPGISAPLEADVTKIGTPYYLDALQTGAYVVKLDLLDGKGGAIPGPLNSATRTINVTRDDSSGPAKAAAPDMPAPPPAASGTAPMTH